MDLFGNNTSTKQHLCEVSVRVLEIQTPVRRVRGDRLGYMRVAPATASSKCLPRH